MKSKNVNGSHISIGLKRTRMSDYYSDIAIILLTLSKRAEQPKKIKKRAVSKIHTQIAKMHKTSRDVYFMNKNSNSSITLGIKKSVLY